MKHRRWVRGLGLSLIAILGLMVLTLTWLLGTQSGARWIVAKVTDRVPVPMTIGQIEGSLLSGLMIRDIAVTSGETEIAIAELNVSISPSVLFNFRRIVVTDFELIELEVDLPAGESSDEPLKDFILPSMARIALPLAIEVRRMTVEQGRIRQSEVILFEWDSMQFEGGLDSSVLSIARFVLEAPTGQVSVSGTVEIGGALAANLVTETALSAGQFDFVGQTEVRGERDRYEVAHNMRSPVEVTVSGLVFAREEQAVTVDLTGRSGMGRLDALAPDLSWRRADLRLRGKLSEWHADFESEVSHRSLGPAALAFDGSGSTTQVQLDRLSIAPEAGGVFELVGEVAILDRMGRGRITVENFSLEPAAGFETIVDLASADVWVGFDSEASFAVSNVQASGLWNAQRFAGRGAASYDDQTLRMDGLELAIGSNRLALNGQWSAEEGGVLSAVIDAPDLSVIDSRIEGETRGTLDVSGTLGRPNATVALVVPELRYETYAVQGAEIDATIEGESLDLRVALDELGLDSELLRTVDLAIVGTRSEHSVTVRAQHTAMDLETLRMVGGLGSTGQWVGTLETLGVTLAPGTGHALMISNTQPAALQLGSEQFSASGLCIDAATFVVSCVDAAWKPSHEMALKGQFAIESLADLPISLEPWRIGGAVKGSIDIAGPLAALTGIAQVSADGLSVQRPSVDPLSEVEQTIDVDTVELSGTWRGGALDVSADVRSSHSANLTAEVTLASWLQPESQIDGRIQWLASELATLDMLIPDIGIGAGRARAEVSLTGTRRDPVVVVDAELVEGEFYIIPTNTVLRDVGVSMNGELLDSLDVRLSAATGDGSAAFDGSAGLGSVGPFVKGTLRATDATLADLEDTRLTASADITLGWHPHSLSVVGKARFDNSAIKIRGLPESAIGISPDAVIDAGVSKDALESVRFRHIDVTTTLGDGVRLSGFGLDTELTGKMRLKQFSDAAPAGFGRLELKNASYRAYGQSLSVTRGVLDFSGPLEAPYLSLRAEREIDTGSVGIDISGSPDALESELFSEPDRTDAEKLSLLLTGRDLSNNTQDDGASLADAAITLGLRQAFGVSSAIRNGVGLDTLTLDGSGRDGRILAGKQLSERIYLQYAYGVFDQLSSVLLRFQINDRLALESVSGEDQAFDLLYEAGSGQ